MEISNYRPSPEAQRVCNDKDEFSANCIAFWDLEEIPENAHQFQEEELFQCTVVQHISNAESEYTALAKRTPNFPQPYPKHHPTNARLKLHTKTVLSCIAYQLSAEIKLSPFSATNCWLSHNLADGQVHELGRGFVSSYGCNDSGGARFRSCFLRLRCSGPFLLLTGVVLLTLFRILNWAQRPRWLTLTASSFGRCRRQWFWCRIGNWTKLVFDVYSVLLKPRC